MDHGVIREHYQASMTPEELILELLSKAVLDVSRARAALEGGRFEAANAALIAAQEIFDELRAVMTGGDAQARRVAEVFALLADELERANINADIGRLGEIGALTDRLRATYALELGKIPLRYRPADPCR